MPPHCDSMDGPVVKAAQKALEAGNVNLVLPYVHKEGEAEIASAFDNTLRARREGPAAREIADLYFFETVVRVHRAGEGAPYTGLKPAGLGEGPVIPIAEQAVESGSGEELVRILSDTLRGEIGKRLAHLMHLKARAAEGLDESREYVEAMLGLEVYSHHLYEAMKASAHDAH